MLIDLAIDEITNDLVLDGSGVLTITTDIKQAIIIAFRLFVEEYDFDLSIGLPWELAFQGGISETDFILECENQMVRIEGISECTVVLIKKDRTAYFSIDVVLTDGGTTNVTVQ